MTKIELSEAQIRTAMKSPEHMKEWLEATGRRYLILDAVELVDALPWPGGHEALTQVIACHRDHRAGLPTGRTETQVDPVDNAEVQVPIMKGETMELEELDRAIRYLIGVASEEAQKRGIKWSLDSQPL